MQQDVGPFGSIVPDLSISAWVINIAFNVSVTVAIAWRLWWMGRKTASLTSTKTNHYGFAIYVVVESGAIFAGANIIALVLYALSSPLTAIGIDVAAQLAVRGHRPSFCLCALSRFVLADIDAALDRCASWRNWSTSLPRRRNFEHGAHRTG